jgi:hypothetical protein
MSRSYKDNYIKDRSKGMKAFHARAVRRNARQALTIWAKEKGPIWEVWEDPETEMFIWTYSESWYEPEFKHPWSITNKYDICDWKYGLWSYEYLEDQPCGEYWYWKNGRRYLRK